MDWPFTVSNNPWNLLGRDFLCEHCCSIDLNEGTLTLRDWIDDSEWAMAMTTVSINGKDVEMMIDTGFSGCMAGSLSLGRELDLPLVSEGAPTVVGVGYKGVAPYAADDLTIKVFGREMRGVSYIVEPEEAPKDCPWPLLGIRCCEGMLLQFNADGTFEATDLARQDAAASSEESRQSEEEPGAAVATGGPQDFDEEPAASAKGAPQDFDEEPAASAKGAPQDFDEEPAASAKGAPQDFDEEPAAAVAEDPRESH